MKSVFLYVAIVAVWGAVLVPMWLRHDADNARSGFWLLGRRPPGDAGEAGEITDDITSDVDVEPVEASESDEFDEAGGRQDEPGEPGDSGGVFGETGDLPAGAAAAESPFAVPGMPASAAVPAGSAGPAPAGADMPLPEPPGDAEDTGPIPSGRLGDPGASSRGQRYRHSRGRGAVMARRRRRTVGLSCLLVAAVVAVSLGVAQWWLAAPPAALLAGHLAMLRAAARVDAERLGARRAARAAYAAQLRARMAQARYEAAEVPYADELPAGDGLEHADVIDLSEQRFTREVYDQYVDAGLRAVGD